MLKTDVLIIGTGIAGLSFAIKTALKRPDLSVTIMTKRHADTTNTRYAQGGIAAVMDRVQESFRRHIDDTLKAGGGICDEDIVRMVVHQAPERLEELIRLGVSFDRTDNGFDLALEGGHSEHRILHRRDMTGLEIENALLRAVADISNVKVLENHFAIDLVVDHSGPNRHCAGVFYFDDEQRIKYIRSKSTVLSTGGCGQLFSRTTNAPIATGDGVAMAHRARAAVADMAYIQFHPTALYEPGKTRYFLLSEALRGFGAHIVNADGKRFVFGYDVRGELATRDIVSKAIATEMRLTGNDHVWLDCRHLDPIAFADHFPAIVTYCHGKNLHPEHDLIPIVPVAHYQCGGIVVNRDGQTTLNRLYAIGECARTGLHGRNRLASNSLLEAVVFAHQASEHICQHIDDFSHSPTVYINKFNHTAVHPDLRKIKQLRKSLQQVMDDSFAGNDDNIAEAAQTIRKLKNSASSLYASEDISLPLIELLNMLSVADIIIEQLQEKFKPLKVK